MNHAAAVFSLLLFAFTPYAAPAQPDPTPPAKPPPEIPTETPPEQKDEKKDEKPKLDAAKFSALKARNLGPAIMSGRIGDLAVNPKKPTEFFVAVASGGVWKTTNGGVTFSPIFDSQGSFSIGCLALDPGNPSTLWVGTGENNSQRSVSWGDGVYLSRDGGKSFKNAGLKESEHIGMIRVDPRDGNVVYVAAQGPLWKEGGERGLYKSTDAGAKWERILHVSDETGISEVHLDPRNPDVLYAAAYQRRRHVWTLINGGPESAIHKSTDAGKTWRKLESGIPGGDKGRIGMAISPANPDVLYAIVEAPGSEGGVFRSLNGGESWDKRSGYMTSSPQYYNELFADPKNADRVYAEDTFLQVSEDGGATFRRVGETDKHVDNHAVWINPDNTDHLLVGCDGGLYDTFDRGATWRYYPNIPTMQFYRVGIDNSLPFYFVYGGTQDNNTIGGPSRTTDRVGITNEDWFVTTGGDGFEIEIDPTDPNTVYCESQDGVLVRYDRKSGEEVDIKPREKADDKPFVFNWDTPLLISPHKPARLYFAGNFLFRSEDRGDSWTRISNDLTRGLDRNQLKVMGKIQKPDALSKHLSTSIFGNAVALTESPKVEGLIYVGTDDGLIHVTEDGGKAWRKIENFSVVPEMTYVSHLEASSHNADTVFATFDNHKMGDFAPYLLRSDDRGRSWRSIAGDLPKRDTCYVIVEDHVKPELLFVGTEYGCSFTLDGGTKWLKVSGLPTIAVRDLEIQRRESDLVMATFGRGFYVLDDYSPLRTANESMLDAPVTTFPMKPALSFIDRSRLGGTKGRGWNGASYYAARNPPFGAVFTYYLKDKVKSRKELRKEVEKKDDWKYPTIDDFRAEDREPSPQMLLTIRDSAGEIVRRVEVPRDEGMHRVAWNLRFPEPKPVSLSTGGKEPWELEVDGTLAPPGRYTARLSKVIDGTPEDIGEEQPFEIVDLDAATLAAKGPAREEKFAFERSLADLQRAVDGAARVVDECSNRLTHLKKAATDTPGLSADVLKDLESLRQRLTDIQISLRGDPTLGKRVEPSPPSISERVNGATSGLLSTTQPPTGTQREQHELAVVEFEKTLSALKSFVEDDLAKMERKMEAAGAPWTPGRFPEWKRRRPEK